jgi:hypothetical protein
LMPICVVKTKVNLLRSTNSWIFKIKTIQIFD